jgi:hypothetical protein
MPYPTSKQLQLITEKKDPKLALEIAKYYQQEDDSNLCLLWLLNAKQFADDKFFKTDSEVNSLLKSFPEISISNRPPNQEAADWLLHKIANHPGIHTLKLSGEFLNFITPSFKDFLSNVRYLQTLEINGTSDEEIVRLTETQLSYIIAGLAANSSLTHLSLQSHKMQNNSFIELIDTLVDNPLSCLKKLNLKYNQLTKQSIDYFLSKRPQLPLLNKVIIDKNHLRLKTKRRFSKVLKQQVSDKITTSQETTSNHGDLPLNSADNIQAISHYSFFSQNKAMPTLSDEEDKTHPLYAPELLSEKPKIQRRHSAPVITSWFLSETLPQTSDEIAVKASRCHCVIQ